MDRRRIILFLVSFLFFIVGLVWTEETRVTRQSRSSAVEVEASYGRDLNLIGRRSSIPGRPGSTTPLYLNTPLSGRIRRGQQHAYRARYTSGTDGGSLKLEARLKGEPPANAPALTISVRNSASAYMFSLPMSATDDRNSRGGPNTATRTGALSVTRIICPIIADEDSTYVNVNGPVSGHGSVLYKYELELSVLQPSVWFLNESAAAPQRLYVSASSPEAFKYNWPEDDSVSSVRITVESGDAGCAHHAESEDGDGRGDGAFLNEATGGSEDGVAAVDVGACAVLAVQQAVCPLTLTMAEVLAVARHLTFTECGSLVVRREHMPDGFYISVLMHGDDTDDECYPNQPPRAIIASNTTRVKPIRILMTPYDADFSFATVPVALAVLFVIIGSITFTQLAQRLGSTLKRRSERPNTGETKTDETQTKDVENEPTGDGPKLDVEDDDTGANEGMLQEKPSPREQPASSLLSPASVLFTCALIIVAFGLNSVVTDVTLERRTGNMDTCYRNELCSHDAGPVPDLNHVLSNLPYIGAGVGFLFAVYAQRRRYLAAGGGGDPGALYGVSHDFDLFASLGAALLLEGFTSGLYHVCPNNRNSHIDFFFIYYMYAAMGAKLWQTRRGVLARFHYTPALVVSTITLLGTLEFVVGRTYSWWLVVVLLHLVSSLIWSSMMYFHGDVGLFLPLGSGKTSVDHRTRRVAVVHLVLNLALCITALAAPDIFSDFSFYALLLFTLNSGVYIAYYMLMKKIRHHERPSVMSVLFMLMGLVVLVPALILFVFYNPYNTSASAALSRAENAGCFSMGFFDAHDVWHFLSAAALFFILMGLLTLDDDLMHTPRNQIPVF